MSELREFQKIYSRNLRWGIPGLAKTMTIIHFELLFPYNQRIIKRQQHFIAIEAIQSTTLHHHLFLQNAIFHTEHQPRMSLILDEIKAEIERHIEALAAERGRELADKLRPILYTNLDRERIQAFTDGDSDRLREYIRQVADRYQALNPYIHEIQFEWNETAWETLFQRLQIWAFNFLVRKGFQATPATQEIAAECASDAASTLLKAHFPYDTEFDPWAHIIVQNVCRKFIRTATKRSVIPEESLLSLDETLQISVDSPLDTQDFGKSLEAGLSDAIARLPEARRQVIILIYFDGMSSSEAAKKMGKSVGAIYSLQFNALEELRKILTGIRDNLNEQESK